MMVLEERNESRRNKFLFVVYIGKWIVGYINIFNGKTINF